MQRLRPEPTDVPLEANGDKLPVSRAAGAGPSALAPGVEIETFAGLCYCVTHAIGLATARGQRPLGELLALTPMALAHFHPDFALNAQADFAGAAFIDTETTGLGAGVYAFMIGVGAFEAWSPHPDLPAEGNGEPTHLVVRQFFMRHPGEERAVLAAIADLLADRRLAVTFNGRTFDLPLLRARYLQNRRWLNDRPLAAVLREGAPHLDLLHPARRLWRRRVRSCRLINLEQMILGLVRTEDDVPGSLIPDLYIDFLRTGNDAAMQRVFYHNREDIVSMVALAQRLVAAYLPGEQCEPAGVEGEDWVSLGAWYAAQGDVGRAESAYRRALDTIRNDGGRAEAFAHLASLLKRQERWDEAAAVWELWLTSVPGLDPTPYVELSKYCEWQLTDLTRAEMWAAWALHNLTSAPAHQRLPGQLADLEHRLARIRRKRQSPNPLITAVRAAG